MEQAASVEPPPPSGASPADVASIDSIVNALYQSISFGEGAAPDWPRFESLFAEHAQIVPVTPTDDLEGDQRRIFDVPSYRAHVEARRRGDLRSLVEVELARRTDVFGPLAQVFSTFERTMDGRTVRGINCILMRKTGEHEAGRWRLVSVAWTDEREDLPLPSRYLPR